LVTFSKRIIVSILSLGSARHPYRTNSSGARMNGVLQECGTSDRLPVADCKVSRHAYGRTSRPDIADAESQRDGVSGC
jgi:hypothetical protein